MNRSLVFAAVVSFGVFGCRPSGPEIVPVSGVVNYQGKPVAKLFLNFMPENGRPSWGVTDQDGRFTLHFDREHEGALVGEHKVFVQFRPSSPSEENEVVSGKRTIHPAQKTIEAKYGRMETTPIKVAVKRNEPVVINLD